MNGKKVKFLKFMLKGLKNPHNFDADAARIARPHCVLGEKFLASAHFSIDYVLSELLDAKDYRVCMVGSNAGLTHKMALQIIRRAIKRWSK